MKNNVHPAKVAELAEMYEQIRMERDENTLESERASSRVAIMTAMITAFKSTRENGRDKSKRRTMMPMERGKKQKARKYKRTTLKAICFPLRAGTLNESESSRCLWRIQAT